MRHHHKRPPPSYHWEGFGRKNTKPPWFDCRLYDKERRDVSWVVKDFGPPSAMNKPRRKGAAPFVHDPDSRIYRPTVPAAMPSGSLSVEVPAPPSSRMLVSRSAEFDGGKTKAPGDVACGARTKLAQMREEATRQSHLQMLANIEVSRRSELGETICGRGRTIKKPLLYPQNVTHEQALTLEKKMGPGLAFDAPPAVRAAAEAAAAAAVDPHPWNQHMYLPRYSRTRADFPGLSRNRSSPASLPSA